MDVVSALLWGRGRGARGGAAPLAISADTSDNAWTGADWSAVADAADNGRVIALDIDGVETLSALFSHDPKSAAVRTAIVSSVPFSHYYSSLPSALSDINAGNVGANADSDQSAAAVGVYISENGLPIITLLQNVTITSGLSVSQNAVLDLNGHKITASIETGDPNNPTSIRVIDIDQGYALRIVGRISGSEIKATDGGGNFIMLIRVSAGSYLEIDGGSYVLDTEDAVTSICIRNNGDMAVRDASIGATAKWARAIVCGTDANSIIRNVSMTVSGKDYVIGIYLSHAAETMIDNCEIDADSDNATGRTYGILLENASGATIIQNTAITADSNYEAVDGNYTVLSTGVRVESGEYVLLKNCTVKGTHAAADLLNDADIVGGYYSSAGHGVYFSGENKTYRVKGATLDDRYIGTHTNTNRNGVGAYIGGYSTANGIRVFADYTTVSGNSYSWVLRGHSGEENNSLHISNSSVSKPIRIDDDTMRLYYGSGNLFSASEATRQGCVIQTGLDYTFAQQNSAISFNGQSIAGELTATKPGSIVVREICLSETGKIQTTTYKIQTQTSILTVSGAAATISADDNIIYECGELTALTVTAIPATGAFSIIFTSGSTPTVTSFPGSLVFPSAFVAKENTRYEINVQDGYAVVGEWPVASA